MNSNVVYFRVASGRVIALAFVCAWLLCGSANGSENCGSIDRVVTALQVVKAIHPEFQREELDVAVGGGNGGPIAGPTDGRTVLITIAPDTWHPPEWWKAHPEGPPPASTPVIWRSVELPLYLSFDFITKSGNLIYKPGCRPSFLNAHGSAARRDVVNLVEAHPEWSDEETLAAAKRAGLRFGPDDKAKLLDSLPLRELSVVYGPLRVKRAKLLLTQEHEKDATFNFGLFWWEITAGELGSKRVLSIWVDPFDGRIFNLHEFERE